MNNRETYFTSLQRRFPSLTNVYIENGNIIFPNGMISLNNVSLEKVPEKVFLMKTESIYIYLSQKLYEPMDVDLLIKVNVQLQENVMLVKQYISKFKALVSLFNSEEGLKNDQGFLQDLAQRKKVIEEIKNSSIINTILNEREGQNVMQNENNGMNSNVSNTNSQSLNGPAIVLKRVNPSAPTVSPISQEIMDERAQSGGFSSIILVIIATLGFGIYLALSLLK